MHRPIDSLDPPHAIQLHFGHGLDIVDELDVRIHDPNVSPLDVANLTRGQQHQPAEDRGLLRDQQRRECHAQDDAKKLGPIAGQHFQRNPTHGVTSLFLLILQDSFDSAQRQLGDVRGEPLGFVAVIFLGRDQHLNDRIGDAVMQTLTDDTEGHQPDSLCSDRRH